MVEDAKVAGEGRQDSASSQVEAAFGAVEGAVGLGVDIVEIERMRKILKRSPAFSRKVFSAEECRYCDATAQPVVHYATRFAAKEAVLKALGTGFSQGIGARDVEVRRTSKGRPYAVLTGRAKQVAQALGVRELPLSLSYTHTDAVACAMAITEGSVRAQQERRDPMEELARQFKEARTMLDDLDAAAPAPAQPQVPDAHSAMGMVRDAHSAMGMVRDAQGGGRLAATRPHGGAGAPVQGGAHHARRPGCGSACARAAPGARCAFGHGHGPRCAFGHGHGPRCAGRRPISGHSTSWRSWRIRLDDRFAQVER